VGKRHVLQVSDGLFFREVKKVAETYPDVDWLELDVDAVAADLYSRPNKFDVVLVTNMFGDILSNAAVAMSGSLGLAASLNVGDEYAVANAGHGSAPDIAGMGLANPCGLLLSATMLLDWMASKHSAKNLELAASAIRKSIDHALAEPATRTRDLGGQSGTKGMIVAITSHLEENSPTARRAETS